MLHFIGDPVQKIDADYYLKYSNSFIKKTPNLLICDARSKVAAIGNKIMGKGWENSQYYQNAQLTFHNIANLDQVRNSFDILLSKRIIKEDGKKGFYKCLGESEWYEYISDLLEFSV